MPLTKARLLSVTEETTVDYAGEPIVVHYYPLRILGMTAERAEAMQADFTRLAEQGDVATIERYIGRLWATYLAAWDVTEEEGGPPIPLDEAHGRVLLELDPRGELLLALLFACREAAVRGKPSGTPPPPPIGAISAPGIPTGSNPLPTETPQAPVRAASRSTRLSSRRVPSTRASRRTG